MAFMDWKRFFGFSWYKLFGILFFAYLSYQSYVFDAVIRGFPFHYYTAEGFCPPGGCPPGEFSLAFLLLDILLWYLALDLCFYFMVFKTSHSQIKNFFVHIGNFFIGFIVAYLLLFILSTLIPTIGRRIYYYFNPRSIRIAIPTNVTP